MTVDWYHTDGKYKCDICVNPSTVQIEFVLRQDGTHGYNLCDKCMREFRSVLHDALTSPRHYVEEPV